MSSRHFLSLLDFSTNELHALIAHAIEVKKRLKSGIAHQPLSGKLLAMIFEKSSTRTRVSFEAGMFQLGGHAMFISPRDSQLGRGEPVEDSARVVSSMVDAILVRTFGHDRLETLAENSTVPVINGLSDFLHPCQLLADLQTWFELRGDIAGAKIAWIGDGNNMCHSYINAAIRFNFELSVASPSSHQPDLDLVKLGGDKIKLYESAQDAVAGADLIVTDVWTSMGQEDEQQARIKTFEPYQVNQDLLNRASKDALFMHCLPAHRGEEVTAEVIDGKQSVVWQEAENRLHAQKALLEFLIIGSL